MTPRGSWEYRDHIRRDEGERVVSECLICAATTDLTVEHIVPQTLWKRWGVNPNTAMGDVPKTRTTLCKRCNGATAALHGRSDMMSFIDTGEPITKKTLQHFADWAFWVLLLLGLARGSGVVPVDEARAILRARFADGPGSKAIPRGVRVYAGLATSLEPSPTPSVATSYSIAPVDAANVLRQNGAPIGLTVRQAQSVQAAQSIGIGKTTVLILGRTESSGADHNARLDAAAATVGLSRIHPLSDPIPTLTPQHPNLRAIGDLFALLPFGDDRSLLPPSLRALLDQTAEEAALPSE